MAIKDMEVYILPGIGDLSWAYSLLVNLGRPLIINGVNFRNRVQNFGKLLPLVKEIRDTDLTIEQVRQLGFDEWPRYKKLTLEDWMNIEEPIYFAINNCLDSGDPIESIFPVMGCNYHYNIPICDTHGPLFDQKPYIVLHTRSMADIKGTKSWGPFEWAELASHIKYFYPSVKFVLIGEENDADAINHLNTYLKFNNITDSIVMMGHDFGEIVQIINDANYVVAWASGIGIISTVVNTPVSMFQFKWLEGLKYNWVPPEMKENHSYMVFESNDTPQYMFEQMQTKANIGQYLNA